MISLKKLIQVPGSPDIALQQKWKESEAAPARIAHVNRLSRDIMDIKQYNLDLNGGTGGTLEISSKKGIVELLNYNTTAQEFSITLLNPEITQNREKFYIQLTAYTTGTAIPIIFGIGLAQDSFSLNIHDVANTDDWGLVYFYYELVKID